MSQHDVERIEHEEEHRGPIPKWLLLAYAVIAAAFLYYLIAGVKVGPYGF